MRATLDPRNESGVWWVGMVRCCVGAATPKVLGLIFKLAMKMQGVGELDQEEVFIYKEVWLEDRRVCTIIRRHNIMMGSGGGGGGGGFWTTDLVLAAATRR
jgi:hypothetical protein